MRTVRNGQKVWPYCSECGCRLFYHSLWGTEYLAHKLTTMVKDRRGHECSSIGKWWSVTEDIKVLIGM